MLEKTLEQSLEQCLEKRMDGSCRSHPPLEDQLLLWTGKTYDPATHTIKSRLTPAYDVTLKQGLVFSSAGAGCLNYGVRNLIATSTTKMRWQFKLNTVAGAGTTRYICGEYNQVGNKRCWELQLAPTNRLLVLLGNDRGTAASVNSAIGTAVPASGDLIDIKFESGIFTMTVNGINPQTYDASATQTVIYNNNAPDLNVGGSRNSATNAYNGSLCCFKIWVDNITDNDTPKFVAPMCDKTGRDIISGTKPAVVGTVDMTVRSDSASYWGDEYGFAVKSGVIYPMKLDGTGYAGLVGDPDVTYQGLIALQGQIEIGAQALLGTLFDFTHTPNTEIEGAGISWDDWDNDDCNSDDVGTAETNLDTSYYSAITASLMTCEGMIYGGTSNVAQRMFFKVANKTMKADGSFLASGGIVTDILVYNRDLTAFEMIKVLKWCKALPFTSVDLVVDENGDFVVVDGNLTYTCLGA